MSTMTGKIVGVEAVAAIAVRIHNRGVVHIVHLVIKHLVARFPDLRRRGRCSYAEKID